MKFFNVEFFDDNWERVSLTFFKQKNAEETAKILTTCQDVNGEVNVIDSSTGEIVATYYEGDYIYHSSSDEYQL